MRRSDHCLQKWKPDAWFGWTHVLELNVVPLDFTMVQSFLWHSKADWGSVYGWLFLRHFINVRGASTYQTHVLTKTGGLSTLVVKRWNWISLFRKCQCLVQTDSQQTRFTLHILNYFFPQYFTVFQRKYLKFICKNRTLFFIFKTHVFVVFIVSCM